MQPIAIVCGSATPVGGALAARLQATGAQVLAIDFAGAPAHPAATLQLAGNLAEAADWRGFAHELQARGLGPTMLAYTAGAGAGPATLDQLEQAAWDAVIERELRGAYLACKHMFPLMRRPGAAVLLATALAGWDARADMVAQSASSGGTLALAQSLALAGAPLGVRVNTVCWPAPQPGQARLDRIPLGRATAPDDVADAIMFLLSDDASYLTGSALLVDGGQSLQSWSNAPDGSY